MGEKLTHLTAAQMREADRRSIEELGIPGAVLMNNAGAAVFREIQRGPVGIVCGKGNNGGDGFVVARLALLAGLDTRVVLLTSPEAVTGDAATFLQAYLRLGGHLEAAENEQETRNAVAGLRDCAVLVDAMLGTGVKGEVRGVFRAAIETWPGVPTIAVDLPSGLDADTGECLGCCIRAHTTVTFQFPKCGFLNPAAHPYLGHVVVADIGIPYICADDEAYRALCLQR
ncbi:MAG: NAD(P)H-hydrate epimerase [Candidatus Hydrogenedentes bacterium]|nr:NAD(P)H-hydrate epimerase [Candidatus Hydrogenedentota bacterium]